MNNRFKFRIWHNSTAEWWKSNFAINNRGNVEFVTDEGTWDMDDPIIEQCTGLKDEKGIDIFEGDIVNTELNDDPEDFKGGLNKVIFKDGCFRFENAVSYEELLQDWISHDNTCYLQVVGNIHENPELLK